MTAFEPGDRVVLDKKGSMAFEGDVLETDEGEGGVVDVLVDWETGDECWYHGYELERKSESDDG